MQGRNWDKEAWRAQIRASLAMQAPHALTCHLNHEIVSSYQYHTHVFYSINDINHISKYNIVMKLFLHFLFFVGNECYSLSHLQLIPD